MHHKRTLKIWGLAALGLVLCLILNHWLFFRANSFYPQTTVGILTFTLTNLILFFATILGSLSFFRAFLNQVSHAAEGLLVSSVGFVLKNLAHEIRRPVSMLQALLGIIAQRGVDSALPTLSKHLPKIDEAVEKLDATLERTFRLSGTIAPSKEETYLVQLLHDAIAAFDKSPRTKGMFFSYEKLVDCRLNVDPKEAANVLQILLEDAYENTPQSGLVSFQSTESNGKFCKLTISYLCSQKPRKKFLSDIFFSSPEQASVDLGLALCRRMVVNHGGEMNHSIKDGLQTVSLTFPLCDFPKQNAKEVPLSKLPHASGFVENRVEIGISEASPSAEESYEMYYLEKFSKLDTPLNILIVDDESFYRSMLAEQLRNIFTRVNVVLADSSQSAVDQFHMNAIDFAFLDLDLGKASEDGFFLLREIKKYRPSVKVCIHTNHACDHFRDEALHLGADLFLPKPAERKHLIDFIGTHLPN